MRHTTKALAVAVMMATCWVSSSQAAFFSFPRALTMQLDRISFETPTLAPMAHTMFCLRYPAECTVHGTDFRKRNVAMTLDRLNELNGINRDVNRDITPQPNLGGLATEQWLVSPAAGDCNDYAVTKRHELLERGWPSRALLLSEVVVPSGEHHLVLVVRMKNRDSSQDADLVLDNLSANLRPVGLTPYQWVRVESPTNPKYWSTVSVPSRLHTAVLAARSAGVRVALADNAIKRRIRGRLLLLHGTASALSERQS
jgi:predicted transglutaminase-like cysteine proteinase